MLHTNIYFLIILQDKEVRAAAKPNAEKRYENMKEENPEEEEEKGSRYSPNQRFVISVTKKEEDDSDDEYGIGIDLVEFKRGKGKRNRSEIYVAAVGGSFLQCR